MEPYKREFIDFLLERGAIRLGSHYSLKGGRASPYFVNIGDLNDGASIGQLGKAYARVIASGGYKFDTLYGIPEKGILLLSPLLYRLQIRELINTGFSLEKPRRDMVNIMKMAG